MKKITFIINNLKGGGAERVCLTLLNGLSKRGVNVNLVVLGLKGATLDLKVDKNIELINLNVHNARKSMFALLRYLNKENPHIILSFNRQISIVLVIIRKIFKFKFSLISRNIIFLSIAEKQKKGLWHGVIANFLIKKLYPSSDYIIAQSKYMKDDLKKYLKINENKLVVINNPINQEIENVKNKINLQNIQKENYFLCIGRLEEQKAFHYAIKAFANIHEKYPLLKLKIVGIGNLESKLKELVNELKIEDKVLFEGFQSDTIPYYLYAKATILTSLFEGFPNVLLESISLGTPVVSFDCPSGPNEIIIDNVNGYLVDYKNEKHLVECMEKILNNSLDTLKLIETVKAFNSDYILDKYEKVLL